MDISTFCFALLALASGASANTHILHTSKSSVYDYSLDPKASAKLVFPSLTSECTGRKGFILNGSLVILGGKSTKNVVKVVPDPNTAQEPEVIASMPHLHLRYSAVQLDEFTVWFAGGYIPKPESNNNNFRNIGYVYDVRNNNFTRKDLLHVANGPVMAQISEHETLVCTKNDRNPAYCGKECNIYHWFTNSWSPTDPLPECSMGAATGIITLPDCKRVVIVVGGHNGKEAVMTTRLYDIESGVWSTSHPLPVLSVFGQGVVIDKTRFLVLGGYGGIDKKVYEYKHDSGWEMLPEMTAGAFSNCAVIKYDYDAQ